MLSLKQTIVERCRAECAQQIQSVVLAHKEYQELIGQYAKRALFPGDAERLLAHLREQPLSDNSPAGIEAHAETLGRLQAICSNPTLQTDALRAANSAFEKLKAPVLALEESAAASLGKQLAEIVEAERTFQAGYGLPYFETPVSRAVAALLAGIRNHSFAADREKITGNPVLNPMSRFDLGGLQMLFSDEAAETTSPSP
jgi:hypothetical protein